VFGRRFSLYFWATFAVLLFGAAKLDLRPPWGVYVGMFFGCALTAWLLIPEALMPWWISSWRTGAWGEENTARELRRLERAGWTVKHDVKGGDGPWNRDHVVAGPALYVLDTKNLSDSRVTVEGDALRVTRLEGADEDDGYLLDGSGVKKQAYWVSRQLEADLGFPVKAYPVLVVWGSFTGGPTWLGGLAVVHGRELVDWLHGRGTDLVRDDKRQAVGDWVRSLPSAS